MDISLEYGKLFFAWLRAYPLSISVILITVVLLYYYLVERGRGIKLSQKFRSSLFESQSKIFLNASQYLIMGERDLAIRELQNAVDLNRESLDTYFALGKLFRSNGEIEKAISIHKNLIARDGLNESVRLSALKELAIDYDKTGFIDKAIETYKDVLKINRDQPDVVKSLCRIYEDLGDWDQAFSYRQMLSKVGTETQSETLSHILVEKANRLFSMGKFQECVECLDDAFRYAPSVSARMLQIKCNLLFGDQNSTQMLLQELLTQHPMFASFIFEKLADFPAQLPEAKKYLQKYEELKNYFLSLKDEEWSQSQAIFLARIRLQKIDRNYPAAYASFLKWLEHKELQGEAMKLEYIKLLIEMGEEKKALTETKQFLNSLQASSTRHYCSECGFNSDDIFWRCPQCHQWETIQFRWKV
jgi:lipopolysaccharide biosynthesis regulator YciM